MIIIKLQGGLGNQLFQFAFGSHLEHQGYKVRYDKWVYTRKSGGRDLRIDCFIESINYINPYIAKILRSNRCNDFDRVFSSNIYHEIISDPEFTPLLMNFKNNYLSGYWMNNIYNSSSIQVVAHKMKLNKRHMSAEFVEMRELVLKDCNWVSIHVRRGDFLSQKNSKIFNTLSKKYYFSAIDKAIELNPHSKFLFFSDDKEWVNENLIAGLFQKEYFNASEHLASDILEFELMRYCTTNILANSTFSWWASASSYRENCVSIMPLKWFNSTNYQNLRPKWPVLKNEIIIDVE